MLFAALFPNRSAAVEQATENIEFVQVSVGCLPRFALLHSAPLSGIEVLAGIITGVCRKEVVSILQRKQRNVAALMFKAFRRKECHGKGMLIIIRNKPALNSIADGFPSLVVLIINVAPLYAGMLIDHEHGSRIERQLLPTRLVFVQQAANGIAQPVGSLIPAVRQQRMERDVEPAVTEGL